MTRSPDYRRFYLPVPRYAAVLCLLAAPVASSVAQVHWIQPLDNEARVLIWRRGTDRYAFKQNEIVTVPVAADGTPQIGFAHSGYSASDPDGRHAVLSLSVRPVRQPLSDEAWKTACASGLICEHAFVLGSPVTRMIDISLAGDRTEEARLRAVLGVPRAVQTLTLPFQVKWSDVDGATLLGWLSGADGLRFVLRLQGTADVGIDRRVDRDDARFQAWMRQMSNGAERFEWRGDPRSVVLSAIDAGCVKDERTGASVAAESILGALDIYSQRLQSVSKSLGAGWTVEVGALETMDWTYTESVRWDAPYSVDIGLSPGAVLSDHPELVKDLSGSTTGLGGLIGG